MTGLLQRLGRVPIAGISYDLGEGYRPVQSPQPMQAPVAKPKPAPFVADDLLTATEAAAVLRVKAKTIPRLRESGRLPAHRLGQRWFYLRGDVERLRRAP